jgi:phosphopantothenoylcysteine decarboxylase
MPLDIFTERIAAQKLLPVLRDTHDVANNGIEAATRRNCLLGCSGSVATLKVPEITADLVSKGFNVLIVCTENAEFFLHRAQKYNLGAWDQFQRTGGSKLVLQDSDEWSLWNQKGDIVLHIELRKWADVLLIAPASADLLAKASVGICDNLLLSVMRAWDFAKPCFLCPAMNTLMWTHSNTNIALNKLREWGWKVIDPAEKLLACNDKGIGAMASTALIVETVSQLNEESQIQPGNISSTLRRFRDVKDKPSVSSLPGAEQGLFASLRSIPDGFAIGFGIGLGLGTCILAALFGGAIVVCVASSDRGSVVATI